AHMVRTQYGAWQISESLREYAGPYTTLDTASVRETGKRTFCRERTKVTFPMDHAIVPSETLASHSHPSSEEKRSPRNINACTSLHAGAELKLERCNYQAERAF